jgi:hypothetical protein
VGRKVKSKTALTEQTDALKKSCKSTWFYFDTRDHFGTYWENLEQDTLLADCTLAYGFLRQKNADIVQNLFNSINLLENYYGSDSKIFLDHLLKVH